jgi:hypothetical protein
VMSLFAALGIKVKKARVRHPTDKAGIEGFFARQDRGVIHRIAGTTMKNPADRKAFDDTKNKGVPYIDLDMLDAKIIEYICLRVHARPLHGFRRGAETCEEIWEKGIGMTMQRPLFNPEEMIRIGGHPIKVHVRGSNMIVWNHIHYYSDDLAAITQDPNYYDSEIDGYDPLMFDAFVDPADIGILHVVNPYDKGSVIEVPASEGWKEYATGRRLFQHTTAVDHHNKVFKTKIKAADDIERATRHLTEEQMALIEKVKKQGAREKLGAYLGNLHERVTIGRIVDTPTSAALSMRSASGIYAFRAMGCRSCRKGDENDPRVADRLVRIPRRLFDKPSSKQLNSLQQAPTSI